MASPWPWGLATVIFICCYFYSKFWHALTIIFIYSPPLYQQWLHPPIISIVIHRAMEFSIHQEDDEGVEMQPAYEGGSAAQMSTVSAGTENGGMNSPPSKPSKKHKPFRPKKKNKYGRTQKGRNNKSLNPLQGTPTAHQQSPLRQSHTPIQSSRPSHGSTPLNELSPKQLLKKAKDLHKLKESQKERIAQLKAENKLLLQQIKKQGPYH